MTKTTTPKCWKHPRSECQLRLAKWYAARHGIGARNMNGGWLYSATGQPLAQGWAALYSRFREQLLEEIWGDDLWAK